MSLWSEYIDTMPRKSSIFAPDALHNIIIRRIKRKAIFKDTADRDNFFQRLSRIISETKNQLLCLGANLSVIRKIQKQIPGH